MRSEELDGHLARLVAGYARDVRGAVAEQHQDDSVFSPLGVWMLLAAATVGARGRSHERLTTVLGCSAPRAGELLDALLSDPPPALSVALALWSRGDMTSDASAGWVRALPSGVRVAAMPSQEQADAWARQATLDLIQRFPSKVQDLAACLVSVVATRVSWEDPFETVDADEALSTGSPWRGLLKQMLRADNPMEAAIVDTEQAGTVAVYEAWAAEGLAVVCVSADPDVSRVRVMSAAQEVAAHVGEEAPLAGRSLFELPVGESHSWSLTERPRPAWEDGQRFERIARAVLPAWAIRSSVDLGIDHRFGADAASETLSTTTGVTGPMDAGQEVMARFDRYGFEAAAVSAVGTAVGAFKSPTEMGIERVAELRFDHPFAVIAVGAQTRRASTTRWVGLPMFEAWVTKPIEPEPERERPRPGWMLGRASGLQ